VNYLSLCTYTLERNIATYKFNTPFESVGLEIFEIGYGGDVYQRDIIKPSWYYPSYMMVYILKGTGRMLTIENSVQELSAGDLIIIPPFTWHIYTPNTDEKLIQFFIKFNGSYVREVLEPLIFKNLTPIIKITNTQGILKLFNEMTETIVINDCKELIPKLVGIFQIIEDCIIRCKEVNKPSWIDSVTTTIRTHPSITISIADLCREYNVSYSLLRKEFLHYFGVSPNRYIKKHCMNYACNQLTLGLSSKEIAYQLGFHDPAHFSKLFKAQVGLSPKEFFKKIQDYVPMVDMSTTSANDSTIETVINAANDQKGRTE